MSDTGYFNNDSNLNSYVKTFVNQKTVTNEWCLYNTVALESNYTLRDLQLTLIAFNVKHFTK